MKPIKEGCTALITHSRAGNFGTVIVGKFIGVIAGFRGDDYWEVDRYMKGVYKNGKEAPGDYNNREKNLMRIDGEEFEEECEQQKIKEYTNA